MKLFLGVDGGQSGTTALIGDETGLVTGIGRGGPCNRVTPEEFSNALATCIGQAGGTNATFECACFGFSGGWEDKEHLARTLVHAEQYVFAHDGLIALVGATAGQPGVVTIAGTGSFCFGRNAAGKVARGGGWGYILGDEGGAFDLVRQALRAALRFEEGWGQPTALRDALLASFDAPDVNDLLHRFYTAEFPRPRIAAFATTIDQLARSGDPVARDLLHSGAQSLATYASAVRTQLFQPGDPARISYIGGVFRSPLLLARFRALMELEYGNRVAPPQFTPAAGALMEAYRSAGLNVSLYSDSGLLTPDS
jgi:N-acetylglucosamine kinase-like BadF-type ATPase